MVQPGDKRKFVRSRRGILIIGAVFLVVVAIVVAALTRNYWLNGRCGYRLSQRTIPDLVRKAEQGDANAARKLQFHYEAESNAEQVIHWLRKAAALGDTDAQFDLYSDLKNSKDVKLKDEALRNLLASAENGNTMAMQDLSDLYFKGGSVRKDAIEAEKWIRRAALASDPVAMNNLSILISRRQQDKNSLAEAYAWSRLAAKRVSPGSVVGKDVQRQCDAIKDGGKAIGISEAELREEADKREREIESSQKEKRNR